MKALFSLIAFAVALLAVAVGRVRTGSGSLSGQQAAEVAVDFLLTIARRHGLAPGELAVSDLGVASDFVIRFLEPGAYLVTRLGVTPDGPAAFGLAFLISWWLWVAAARTIYFVLGRIFGFANMARYRWWLLAGPPWRPIFRIWLVVRRFFRQFTFGTRATACWTGPLAAMTLPFNQRDAVFIGRLWWKGVKLLQPLGIRGPRHIAVVAASGAGKTRWAKGWLGMLPREASAFIIDCDGDIVNTLGPAAKRAGHKIINLDPFGLSKFPGACWNALDELTAAAKRHGRQAVVRYGQTLAEGLVAELNASQPVFTKVAREFVGGVILFVWLFEPAATRNLVRVRELIARGMPELVVDPKQDAFGLFLRQMERSVDYDDECDGAITDVIARSAGAMRSGNGREGNPFRTSALSATAFIDMPEIAAISRRSDFTSEDLKKSNPWVFFIAPVTDIQTKLSGLVRSVSMTTMYTFQNIPGGRSVPCAFLLDEFPSLGRIEILETAAPVFRKYGIRLVVITQDLERLEQAYPKSWGGFIGNAQATLWMGSDHQQTVKHLSDVLGTATREHKVGGGFFSKTPVRTERREYPLLTPDQIKETLDPDRSQIIVTRTGKTPLLVSYEGYDKALPVWRYEPSTEHREPILRRLTRKILRWFRP